MCIYLSNGQHHVFFTTKRITFLFQKSMYTDYSVVINSLVVNNRLLNVVLNRFL